MLGIRPLARARARTYLALAVAPIAATQLPASCAPPPCDTTVSSLPAAHSALLSAGANKRVCLADGTYAATPFTGHRSTYATLTAAHPGKATITGVYRLNASYVRLENLAFSGEVQLAGGSDHIDISHNLMQAQLSLASTSAYISDVMVRGNKWTAGSPDALFVNRYHDGDGDGVGLLVEGNEFTGIVENGGHNDCLQSVYAGDHLVFRRNYAHDNRCQFVFVKDQTSPIDGITVQDNLDVRNQAACTQVSCSAGAPFDLTVYAPARNVVISRNTIWSGAGGMRLYGGLSGVWVSQNVIARALDDGLPNGALASGGNRFGSIAGGYPLGSGDSLGAPSFVDPAHDDMRLTNGSAGVTWRPADQVYGPVP
jgi:hypothetical protein